MPDPMALPPGATMQLPPGATLVSDTTPAAQEDQPKPAYHSTISAAPTPLTPAWFKSKAYTLAEKGLDLLPAAGATAGSILGFGMGAGPGSVPGAVVGATLGGGAGEASRQLGRRALGFESPETSLDAAKDIAIEGGMNGAIEGITRGGGKVLSPVFKRAAQAQYIKALAPTKEATKRIAADIAPEMIDRGVTGSLDTINKRAVGEIGQLKPQLEAAYGALKPGTTHAQSPISETLNALDKLKSKYMVGGEVANPHAVGAIEGVQRVVEQYDNAISPQELRQLKQVFDESVASVGGYTGTDLATKYAVKAQKVAAGRIRDILHNAGPDAAGLDKEISFWLDVKRVTQATAERQTGQQGGIVKSFGPYAVNAAGLGGTAFGGPGVGLTAATITYAAGLTAQLVKSPEWRTVTAVGKDRIADFIAKGDVQQAAALASRLGIAGLEGYMRDPAPIPQGR